MRLNIVNIANDCFLVVVLCVLFSLSSCEKSEESVPVLPPLVKYKVAVVLPARSQLKWTRTVDWALENLTNAQTGLKEGVTLDVEWYDEDVIDIHATASALSSNKDIVAIIGPLYSSNAAVFAEQCSKHRKPLLLFSSSDELARKYSINQPNKSFMWLLSETDISHCELLLSQCIEYGFDQVSLLVKDDIYGKTFEDWFGFQAKELGLKVGNIYTYNAQNLNETIDRIAEESDEVDALISIPSSIQDFAVMRGEYERLPYMLYSDIAYLCLGHEDAVSKAFNPTTMEGFTISSDPESGFDIAYNVRYNELPTLGESHLYDALSLVLYAAFNHLYTPEDDIRESLIKITSSSEKEQSVSWMGMEDINRCFKLLQAGVYPNLRGASGTLDFDKKYHTLITQSYYGHWVSFGGKPIILEYFSSDGSKRSEPTLANWYREAKKGQAFEDMEDDHFKYPPKTGNWALLVAGSQGWSNYRHQADILSIYQLLKNNGFSDDRIILIMEDDLAYHVKNRAPGKIRVDPEGDNLYTNVVRDYKLSELTSNDFSTILKGEKSSKCPIVLESGAGDNVFMFWSGHGETNRLLWGESHDFGSEDLFEALSSMSENDRFRKMLISIETCFSGSIAERSEGIPGVLFYTASNPYETSKASLYNDDLGIWMTNSFTRTFREKVYKNPEITLKDLYLNLFKNTLGSHVKVYNEACFGSVYKNSMKEFILK